MIDPKHLRLGNYIRYNEKFPDDPELELDNEGPLNEDDFNYMLIDDGTFRKNADYVPLTIEWLLKFGFQKDKHDWVLQHDPRAIPAMRIYNPQENLFLDDKTGTIFKTVHHLQNYFFALYLKELTLNDSL